MGQCKAKHLCLSAESILLCLNIILEIFLLLVAGGRLSGLHGEGIAPGPLPGSTATGGPLQAVWLPPVDAFLLCMRVFSCFSLRHMTPKLAIGHHLDRV